MLVKQSAILTITPFFSPNIGGVETHLDNLSLLIKKNKFKHSIITYQPLTNKINTTMYIKNEDEEIFRIPWPKFNLFYKLEKLPILQFPYLFTGIFMFGFFYLLFKGGNIKIIHGHGLAAGVGILILAKLFKKKAVVSLHTIYKFSERNLLANIVKIVFTKLDKILVLAKGCKEDLIKIGIQEEKIETYVCWVNNKDIFVPLNKNECRNKLGLPQNKFIVLFVGRFSEEKGLKVVLEAAGLIKNDNIKLLLIGDGPMLNQVKYFANKNNNIILSGNILNEKLPLYYNSADVLLFGSVDQDYYGRITMEALSCGLPVILSRTTKYFGIEKKVTLNFPDEEIGFFVEPNPAEIAEKLNNIYNSRDALSSISNKARKYALENFGESNGDIFFKTYRTLLENYE